MAENATWVKPIDNNWPHECITWKYLIDPTSVERFRVYDEEALAWDGFFRTTKDPKIAALHWRTWTLQAVVTMIKAEKQSTHGLPDPGDPENGGCFQYARRLCGPKESR